MKATESSQEEERRRLERYLVGEDVFITLRPQFDRIGTLKDISRNGAGFVYIAHEPSQPVERAEVDIFCSSMDLYLSNVPCKIVYDRVADGIPSMGPLETRQCGLCFDALSDQHRGKLEALLENLSRSPRLSLSR